MRQGGARFKSKRPLIEGWLDQYPIYTANKNAFQSITYYLCHIFTFATDRKLLFSFDLDMA